MRKKRKKTYLHKAQTMRLASFGLTSRGDVLSVPIYQCGNTNKEDETRRKERRAQIKTYEGGQRMIDTLQCKCVGLRAIAPSIARVKHRAWKLTTKETKRTQTRKQNTGGEQRKRYSGLQNDGFEASDLNCEGKITCFFWNIQGLLYTKKAESKWV